MVPLPIVILIFISSNYTDLNQVDRILGPTTVLPEKKPINNNKNSQVIPPKVNDLSISEIRFPDDIYRRQEKKIIQEKVIPDDDDTKGKQPVPLYSLVKNTCGDGYALDENGICQKVVTVRSGKSFDSERRRKRFILDYDLVVRKPKQMKLLKKANDANKIFEEMKAKCSKISPGMVPDGAGGCTRAVTFLGGSVTKKKSA